MKKLIILPVLVIGILFIAGKPKPPKKDDVIIIETAYGTMYAILFDQAPEHKANFLKLAREGFFDSTTFHRVIQNFVIQGGDPLSKDDDPLNDGTGTPGYTLSAEFHSYHMHTKGALASARGNDPEKRSNGSQFYIVHGEKVNRNTLINSAARKNNAQKSKRFQELLQKKESEELRNKILELQRSQDYEGLKNLVEDSKPLMEEEFGPFIDYSYTEEQLSEYEEFGGKPHLDWEYTVFGKLISGYEVLDSIAAVEVDRRSRPLADVPMKIRVETMKRKKITKEYGYTYPEIKSN